MKSCEMTKSKQIQSMGYTIAKGLGRTMVTWVPMAEFENSQCHGNEAHILVIHDWFSRRAELVLSNTTMNIERFPFAGRSGGNDGSRVACSMSSVAHRAAAYVKLRGSGRAVSARCLSNQSSNAFTPFGICYACQWLVAQAKAF